MYRTLLKKIIDTIIFLESLFLCKETHTQKRVLILRKDTLGDYILFYPTLSSYRKKYSDAEITGEHVHVVFPTIDYKLFQEETALQTQKEYELENGKYVIFFPGSGTRFKVWPVEKFAEIADYFIEKKITPVICGSKGEIDLVESILMNMKHKEDAVNLSGKTDLPTMIQFKSLQYVY